LGLPGCKGKERKKGREEKKKKGILEGDYHLNSIRNSGGEPLREGIYLFGLRKKRKGNKYHRESQGEKPWGERGGEKEKGIQQLSCAEKRAYSRRLGRRKKKTLAEKRGMQK